MIDKEFLMKEFDKKFSELKLDLGFRVSFEELENEFFLRDAILEAGYVKENFKSQVASRIIEYFRNWAAYLNNLLTPQPVYVNQLESKIFSSEKDKKEIWEMIKVCMKFSSMYSSMFLNRDKVMQKEFFDSSYEIWVNFIRPKMGKIIERVYRAWEKD